MSPRSTKKDQKPIAPAPSVLDAVNASRGGSATAVVAEEPPVIIIHQRAEVDEEPVAVASAPVEPVAPPEPVKPVEPAEPVAKPAVKKPAKAPARPSAPADDSSSVDDLGHYVTRVMADARRAAAEFLASVDADAARRAAVVRAQADAEAQSVREAAIADAEQIRAAARLEGERLIAERLRIAIDLTDELYGQASQILAAADHPDEARRHLARFVGALTDTAENAAESTKPAGKSRG